MSLNCFQRVNITAKIDKLQISLPYNCEIGILWKRGSKKIETKEKIKIQKGKNSYLLNETLSLQSKISLDEKKNLYHSKLASFFLLTFINKQCKIIGRCDVDFSTFLNLKVEGEQTISFELQKCPDPQSQINIHFTWKLISDCKYSNDNSSQG